MFEPLYDFLKTFQSALGVDAWLGFVVDVSRFVFVTLLGLISLSALYSTIYSIIARLSPTENPVVRLFWLAERLFSPANVEGTFEPLVADWHFEYLEALAQSRTWKARWISLSYYYRLVLAMFLSALRGLVKYLIATTK